MKLLKLILLSLGLTGFLSLAEVSTAAEEASAIEQTSPNGNYQIQWVENQDSRFIVSSKNPAERAPLPGSTGEVDPAECQVGFFYSPDEKWIFYAEHWRHHGLLARELYHHETGVKFAPSKGKGFFTRELQSYAARNGFEKSDFIDEREKNYDHLGTAFRAWSLDSSRLLIGIYAEGSEHGPLYVYFNTRTKALEQTPYLRELNKAVAKQTDNYAHDIVCAEPTAPLPPESELKARLDALNEKLNRAFAARVERTKEQDDANDLRQVQDKWVKMRDEGLKTYLAFARKGEEERRRLQFLSDVTAARIDEISQSSIAALTR